MTSRWLIMTLHIGSSLCQYMVDTDMRADMRFGEDNDRFDVANIIMEQNRASAFTEDQPALNEFDYRRIGRDQVPLSEFIKHQRLRMNEKLTKKQSGRRRIEDFAYHDNMNSEENDSGAYDRNLLKYKANNEDMRRNLQVIDLAKFRTGPIEKPGNKNKNKIQPPITDGKSLHDIVLRYLHGGGDLKDQQYGRRKETDPDNEVLLHYAVPIHLKVNGYLEVPQIL